MTYYIKMQKAAICAEGNVQESKQDISEQCLAMAKVLMSYFESCPFSLSAILHYAVMCCIVLCYTALYSTVQYTAVHCAMSNLQ